MYSLNKTMLTRTERLNRVYESHKTIPTLAHLRYGTRFVPGCGSDNPVIMFIGEFPSVEENAHGQPLVGAIGILFNQALSAAGINPTTVFVTNVLKFRTPGGRPPRDNEIIMSVPCLADEIKILKPHIIVAMGRMPLHVLFPGSRLSDVRGQRLIGDKEPIQDTPIFPIDHPNMALYSAENRGSLFGSFKVIAEEVESFE